MVQHNRIPRKITFVALTLLVLAPLTAEAGGGSSLAQLCLKIACVPILATLPKITAMSVNSNFAPGGVVIVYGSGFGSTKGQLLLTGLKRYTGEGLKPFPLTIFEWHNTAVGGTIPSDITAVKDQQATLQLKTATNQGSKGSIGVTVYFKATREVRPLQYPDPAVKLLSCGTFSHYDYCNRWVDLDDEKLRFASLPGHTFYGFHSGCCEDYFYQTDFGHDGYEISLTNGWVLDSVLNLWQGKSSGTQLLAWHPTCGPGGGPWAAAPAFPSGAASWRPSVCWKLHSGHGSVWYGALVSIIGPAGVSHWH